MEEKTSPTIEKRKIVVRHPGRVILGFAMIPVAIIVFILIAVANSNNRPNPSSAPTTQTTASASQSPCAQYGDAASLKQNAIAINYKQLEKDPDSFSGKIATFTGRIVQILESNGEGVIRLAPTKNAFGWDPNNIVWVEYQGHNDAVQDDVVSVYGPITGSKTYTSQANYEITIPGMLGCLVLEKTNAPIQATNVSTQQSPSPAPVVPSSVPQTPASWHTVTVITTATTKNTPPFTIQGSKWRATWNCQAAIWGQYDNAPTVYARPTSGFGGGVVAFPSACPSGDITYFYGNPGDYYLDVTIYSPATMTVTIEDYY